MEHQRVEDALLLKQEEMEIIICHPSADPLSLAGCENTGPMPPAREMLHPKRAKPTIGPMTALAANQWRSLWIGTQVTGREMIQ